MDNRRSAKSPLQPVVVGTGLVALDVVIADDATADPILCVGGTCGNVLIALAYLGWKSYPIARLRSDSASKRVLEDLKHWGVALDFVSLSDCGSTPVVVQHIRASRDGKRLHSFSRKCPACGAWLPWYKAIKAANVPDLATRLPKANLFYFDRTSRGAVNLAHNARKDGAIVMFEPSAESDPALLAEAIAAAHIVKIASDRLRSNEELLHAKSPILLIETRGAEGLRFSIKPTRGPRVWKVLPAFPVEHFRDSAGAGDWCTAGIIHALGPLGPEKLTNASLDDIIAALKEGQAMATWACQFDGARGGMYLSSKDQFKRAVRNILNGKTKPIAKSLVSKIHKSSASVWCDCCSTSTLPFQL